MSRHGLRVPTRSLPQQQLSGQSLAPFRAQGVTGGEAVGRAVSQLSQQGTSFALHLQRKQAQDDRFKAGVELSKFETEFNDLFVKQRSISPPGDTNFGERIDAFYGQAEDKFLADRVAPNLQQEFKFRTEQLRSRFSGAALKHQYNSTNTYYETSVSAEYSKTQENVKANPDTLQEEQDKLAMFIDSTGLPAIQKAKLGNTSANGLAGVVYQEAVKAALVDASKGGPGANIVGTLDNVVTNAAAVHGVSAKALKTIAWLESRGNPNANNPKSSAGGLFQFIDGTAKDYGLVDRFDPEQAADAAARLMRDNRNGLIEALKREPTDGELYLAHQQGLTGAAALLANPDKRAVDIVSEKAIILNGGDVNMTAGEFTRIWIDKAENGVSESDPRFGGIPFDERKKLRAAAEREAGRDIAAGNRAATGARDEQFENLMQGILDGTAGQKQFDEANESVGFTTQQRQRAQRTLNVVDKDAEGAAKIQAILASPSRTYNPVDDAVDYNRWFGKGGRAALENKDAGYVTELANSVQRTADIPTDAVGLLDSFTRSSDSTDLAFGMQALETLQQASPEGFEQRVKGELRKRYQRFLDGRSRLGGDALQEFIQGGDLLQRQANPTLDNESREFLKEINIPELFADFTSSEVGLDFFDADIGNLKAVGPKLIRQGTAAYTANYRLTQDAEAAEAAMLASLDTTWGKTFIGGQGGILAEHPVEKVYPEIEGGSVLSEFFGTTASDTGHQPYEDQVRQDFAIESDETFELIADAKTAREVALYNQGRLNRLPTYQIRIFDADGVARIQRDRWGGAVPK